MRQRHRRPLIALSGAGAAVVRHFPGQNTAGARRGRGTVRRGAIAAAVKIVLRVAATQYRKFSAHQSPCRVSRITNDPRSTRERSRSRENRNFKLYAFSRDPIRAVTRITYCSPAWKERAYTPMH